MLMVQINVSSLIYLDEISNIRYRQRYYHVYKLIPQYFIFHLNKWLKKYLFETLYPNLYLNQIWIYS